MTPDEVAEITVRLPEDGARIVDGRAIPSINVQHVLAMALVDGAITFESVHDVARLSDPAIRSLVDRTRLIADPAMWDPVVTRQATVEITARSGEVRTRHVRFARGTPQNPLTSLEVDAKARSLMEPVIGAEMAEALVDQLRDLPGVADAREFRRFLGRRRPA